MKSQCRGHRIGISESPASKLTRLGCDAPQMRFIDIRHLAVIQAVALLACSLGGCGTINEKLAAGVSDAIPQWAGGLPRDAPPRPGTAEYDEFMRERERKQLEPATARGDTSNASSLEPTR